MVTIVEPGHGEVISDRRERTLLIKVGRPELVLTWSRYEQGESGPPPHVHRQHSDCFHVLEGELTFELGSGGGPLRAGGGASVLVPPNVIHTFRCEGPDRAVFLNIHAPGAGFDDYLRALRDGRDDDVARFDSFDPPADGGRPASEAVVSLGGEGGRVADLAIDAITLVPGAEAELRTFWLVDGRVTIDGGRAVEPGSLAFVTSDARVTAQAGDAPVRLVELVAPAP
jgi:quercetin dioxygenase-like cupin family protein